MNPHLLEERLESIYLQADKTLAYGSYVNMLIAISFGLFYNNLFLSLAGGAILLASFFVVNNFVTHRTLKSSLLSSIFLLWVALYIIISRGLLETRYLYFSYLFFFVIYQSFTPVIVTTLIGTSFVATYFLSILLNLPTAEFMSTYLLEAQNASFERFYVSLFTLVIGAFSTLWIVRIIRERTINNIKSTIFQEEQIKIFENNKKFADEIAQGNLEIAYEVDSNDQLGNSLNLMRKGLAEAFRKQNQDKFINVGIAEISEILRTYLNDINNLSNEIIRKLVKYMNANQGAVFIVQEEDNKPYLELKACYAYDRKKYINKRIEVGEGLVGQAYLEQDTIYMTDIPGNYVSITSGLGGATPNSLIIIPLKANDIVVGVIEMASFNAFTPHEIDFLNKVAESIASTIVAAKTNYRTNELLQSSRQMTERMQAQEAEMRQNIEELQAIQEEMNRKINHYQQLLEKKDAQLKQITA